MSLENYTQVERLHGSTCWLHNTKNVWIVEYQASRIRPHHYQTYKAVQPVPKGRMPWTIDNRRMGPEDGIETLEQAAKTGDANE